MKKQIRFALKLIYRTIAIAAILGLIFIHISGEYLYKANKHLLKAKFPFGLIHENFVDKNNNLYIYNSTYSRIHVYNSDGKYIRGWNLGGGATIRFTNKIIHAFRSRSQIYEKYSLTGELIESIPMDRFYFRELMILYPYESDKRVKVIHTFFGTYIYYNRDDGQNVVIRSPFYLWLITYPFPGTLFIIIVVIKFVLCRNKFREHLWPKIKKRNFYKI
ncbi:MAG: hypothetical protein ISS80_06000 [Candidatus Cloacimonetes bacterium]|nr:hypothetical protein [Candidatus Cloacimonadota bacterium]MBL7149608.1 hypothetical protein [Candidatus Cloacimonadota bacterium]